MPESDDTTNSATHDNREAMFLLGEFCKRHPDERSLVKPGDRFAAANRVVKEFAPLAEKAGLAVQDIKGTLSVWVKDNEESFSANVTVTTGGKIYIGRATVSGPVKWEVPVTFNPVTVAFEGGPRQDGLPPGMLPWEIAPRSAVAVLTEQVIAALERGRRPE